MAKSISFSGGGYNCIYHFGVVKYIFEHKHIFHNITYLGASGGAGIISFIIAYENDPDNLKILDEVINELKIIYKKNVELSLQVNLYIDLIKKYVNEEKFNTYIKNNDRCQISLTNITYLIPRNNIKTNFANYKEFINTLKASACIPYVLDNKIRKINNNYYLDGGLTNNIPTIDNDTIKISCLYYPFMNAHIYPKVVTKLYHAFVAPPENYMLNMFDLGYCDASKYMKKYNNIEKYIHENENADKQIFDILDENTFTSTAIINN